MYRLLAWCGLAVCLIIGAVACLFLVFGHVSIGPPVVVPGLGPGLTYTNQRIARVPWSIHVLRIDRAQTNLFLYSSHARGKVLAVSLIADQARSIPQSLGKAVAGINGDFYVRDNRVYAGDPRGLQIVNGELLSAPDTESVWFDRAGNPHLDEVKGEFAVTWPDGNKTPFGLNEQRTSDMAVLYTPSYGFSTRAARGRELILEKEGDSPWLPLQASRKYRAHVREVSVQGDTPLSPEIMVLSLGSRLVPTLPEIKPGMVLEISTATAPDLTDVKAAIGGGPALIKEGKPFALTRPPDGSSDAFSERSKYQRHPRSAVGWNQQYIYFVVVDGRQPGLSAGMKLAELAQYFLSLGCTEAMNFDGGKSAQLWINGRIVNSPCQGDDPVANSLLVIRKARGG
jgi:hypothetical protein